MKAVSSEPEGEVTYCETLDEALAVAFADCEPGTVVTVHDEGCEADENGDGCTCDPDVYTTGASA